MSRIDKTYRRLEETNNMLKTELEETVEKVKTKEEEIKLMDIKNMKRIRNVCYWIKIIQYVH
eukprot:gnl/Chilomastix_caulleri/6939.p2 GENE.gnl/Chilomastix_caulleri/6939~~gnl/Chilomastix_caulleri/6939.p2  ORF type:complete len:62 (+),score=8.08 gnl/Chilomastix_caulleri/6939:64-249(+)